jgi:hopanoid biosynthesis associated RND transporter like protein HpnN
MLRREQYLGALADSICRRPWVYVIVFVLLAVASTVYSIRELQFKTSRNDLIGRDSEYWRIYSQYVKEFRSEEDYVIVCESSQTDRNRAAVDALAKELVAAGNNPHTDDSKIAQQFLPDDVFLRVNFEAMEPWFLYYLPTNDLAQISASLKDFNQLVAVLQQNPRLATFFDAMNQMLDQMATAPEEKRRQMEAFLPTITAIVKQMPEPPAGEGKSRLLSPWASAFFSEDMVGEAEKEMKWQGYHVFQDGKMFLLLVHPRLSGNTSSPEHHAATIPKLRRIMEGVRKEFPEVHITLTGEPVLDYDEMITSERDATKSSILTVVLIAIVVVFGFRDWLRMLLSICCLIMVIAITMGYTTLSIGHLNMITITFAVMILGLGEDLGVQFISRYEEELAKSGDRAKAIRGAMLTVGPSIIIAGVTNSAAFFAMCLSGFRGVTELGIIAGGGMFFATVGMMVLLPALLLSIRRKTEKAHIPKQVQVTGVERILLRRPWLTLSVCGALTIGAVAVGWQAKFNYNVLKLQSRGLESVETEMRLLKAAAESTIYASVVADNLAQARELQARLSKLPSVAAAHSIAELIPEDQEAKAPMIREIRQRVGNIQFNLAEFQPADGDAVVNALGSLRLRASKLSREAAERNDKASEKVLAALADAAKTVRVRLQETGTRHLGAYEKQFYADLQNQLALLAEQSERPMTVADVTPELQHVLVGKTGKFLIRVFPKENIWERKPLERFVTEVSSVAPQATGTPAGLYEFVEILQRGYIKAALWAFLVIAIMVFLDLRGVLATLLTLVPLVVGTIWMIGAMVLFRIQFNPANILTLPLMVGIGVAYGIYVVQRYREDGEATFYGKSTGRALILSALTAVIAFGSLLIGAHRGICSLGLVMCIGVVACLLASMTLLPALLEVARRRKWKI